MQTSPEVSSKQQTGYFGHEDAFADLLKQAGLLSALSKTLMLDQDISLIGAAQAMRLNSHQHALGITDAIHPSIHADLHASRSGL